jgi:hypothetical protein
MVVVAAAACLVASVSSPAQAAGSPATPTFGQVIEPLASYDGAKTCLPKTTQPGVAKLQALLTASYGTTSYLTWRACSGSTATSEHNEGRALDWMLNAGNASDVAIANAFGVWLFATDKYGNTYANARRLGVMYIIWHGRMWRAYDVAKGWQPYTGSEPHNDHMHISLSWAGANAATSFWNPVLSFPGITPPAAVPAPYLVPGLQLYGGQQWLTSCVARGSSGGRFCTTQLRKLAVVKTAAGWATAKTWVRDSYNYLDYDGPAWAGAIKSTPGDHVWNGSTYRTTCTPDASSGARACSTSVWTSVVVFDGTSYVLQQVWLGYSHVWLLAPPAS